MKKIMNLSSIGIILGAILVYTETFDFFLSASILLASFSIFEFARAKDHFDSNMKLHGYLRFAIGVLVGFIAIAFIVANFLLKI